MNDNASSSTRLTIELSQGGDDVAITLGLLNAISKRDTVTQRSMAQDLGIALGLANAYLKRCVSKGLIKVQHIPRNRYAYYLTPKGFAEKSRLTAEYLSQSLNFFRLARSECESLIQTAETCGWSRLALLGAGDLGEIATLCGKDANIELIGFLDSRANEDRFAGLPVYHSLKELGDVDAILITDATDPQVRYDSVRRYFPRERILIPKFLNVDTER
jgi:DNA-binding MarR family transcriptional regulator